MELLSPHSPKKQKLVPPIPGTALQNKIEKSLGSQMLLQLKQEMGIFQASILEAFNKLCNQQISLHAQINKPRANATVSKPPSHSVDQLDPDLLQGTSQVSDPNPRPSDPRDTGVADSAGPSLPPYLQKRPPPPKKKKKKKKNHKSAKYISSSSEEPDSPPELFKSCTGDQPGKNKGKSQEAHRPMTFVDLKQKPSLYLPQTPFFQGK